VTIPEDPRKKFNRLVSSEAETQPETPGGDTPPEGSRRVIHRPMIDENGMPLPRRVEEVDLGATRVSSAAFEHTPMPRTRRWAAPRRFPAQGGIRPSRRQPLNWSRVGGCLLRGLIISLFAIVALALALAAAGIYEYF